MCKVSQCSRGHLLSRASILGLTAHCVIYISPCNHHFVCCDTDMPIRGTNHSALISDDAPFFRSLSDLDDWAATPARKLEGVLPYVPRSDAEGVSHAATRGKLLVNYTKSLVNAGNDM